jgi:predicted alpha/beta-fold hydrolase
MIFFLKLARCKSVFSLFILCILGGIILGKYLSCKKENSHVSHAMIVSAPFNPKATMVELERYQNMFINKNVSKDILTKILKHRRLFEKDTRYDFERISNSTTLRDLDTHFHAIQFGYKTCDELYEDARLDKMIQNIKTPTVFLSAANDMFSPIRSILKLN